MRFGAGERLLSVWGELRASLWFVPGVMAILAIGLALLMLEADHWVGGTWLTESGWVYSRSAGGARDLLSTVASSMITIAGLVFSILVVALQLASSQFGPRVLRNFMGDRGSQLVLGTFIATFLYCLMVMRTIADTDVDEPRLAVTMAVVLAVASLSVLIYFLHHAAASIHAPNVIAAVAKELEVTIERMYPSGVGEPAEAPPELPAAAGDEQTVCARRGGYLQRVDSGALLGVATRHDLALRVLCRPGEFLLASQPIVAAMPAGRLTRESESLIRRAFVIGGHRTPDQDVAFTFEQLAQVTLRALSPAFNDPFTAVACIEHLGAGLDHLLRRREPAAVRVDEDGVPRVIAPGAPVAELINLALAPVVEASRGATLPVMALAHTLERLAARAGAAAARDTLAMFVRIIASYGDDLVSARAREDVRASTRRALHALVAAG